MPIASFFFICLFVGWVVCGLSVFTDVYKGVFLSVCASQAL